MSCVIPIHPICRLHCSLSLKLFCCFADHNNWDFPSIISSNPHLLTFQRNIAVLVAVALGPLPCFAHPPRRLAAALIPHHMALDTVPIVLTVLSTSITGYRGHSAAYSLQFPSTNSRPPSRSKGEIVNGGCCVNRDAYRYGCVGSPKLTRL